MSASSDPAAEIESLVRSRLGARVARIEPVDAGLATRSFFRVHTRACDPATLIARVEAEEDAAGRPAGAAPEPPLEPLRTFLERHGLPVPHCYALAGRGRIALLEDLGPLSLAAAAERASPEERRALYAEACSLVPRFQRARDPEGSIPAFARRLDAELFAYKAALFAWHSLPRALRRKPTEAEADAVRDAFAWIGRRVRPAPHRLAHRDFQSSNLHVREGARSGRRLAVIDFQGAFLAPPEYDLVCLLRDSYVELPEEEITRHLEHIRPELPDAPPREELEQRFDLLTLTRKGKDHARFLYAAEQRGDTRYLRHVPATVRHLRRAAARTAGLDPCLGRLAELCAALPETPCAP